MSENLLAGRFAMPLLRSAPVNVLSPFPRDDPDGTIGNTYGTAWEPFARGDIHLGIQDRGGAGVTPGFRQIMPDAWMNGRVPAPPVRPGTPDTAAAYQHAFRLLNASPLGLPMPSPHGIGVPSGVARSQLVPGLRGVYHQDTDTGGATITDDGATPSGGTLAHELTHRGMHGVRNVLMGAKPDDLPARNAAMGLTGQDHDLMAQAYPSIAEHDTGGDPMRARMRAAEWRRLPETLARVTGQPQQATSQMRAVSDLAQYLMAQGALPGRPMGPR